MAQCPCGTGFDLNECCGPIIRGDTPALTAEALMRSRYTAFVCGDLDHIERTYASEKRDAVKRPVAKDTADSVEWVSLEIFGARDGGEGDDTGIVDFAARYRKDGALLVHRERSNFRREEGRWVYVDGDIDPNARLGRTGKVGRNQPCPCGSGKKFKRCCGA